jgi:hypothetical protein
MQQSLGCFKSLIPLQPQLLGKQRRLCCIISSKGLNSSGVYLCQQCLCFLDRCCQLLLKIWLLIWAQGLLLLLRTAAEYTVR